MADQKSGKFGEGLPLIGARQDNPAEYTGDVDSVDWIPLGVI